jgi:hypothetical protein
MSKLASGLTGAPIDTRGAVDGQVLTAKAGVFRPSTSQVNVGFSGASIEKTSDQTGVVNSAKVTWDTAHFDTDGYFDDTNDEFVIPADGHYLLVCHLQHNDTSTDNWFEFTITTSQTVPADGRFGRESYGQAFIGLEGSQIVRLDAGDRISVLSVGDASYTIRGASQESWFQITRLGTTGGQSNLLGEVVLTADATNIEIANIPGTYKDLRIEAQLRGDNAALFDQVEVTVGNGSVDTGTNYRNYRIHDGSSGGFIHYDGASNWLMDGAVPGNTADAGLFGYLTMSISDYAEPTNYRHFTSVVRHIRTTDDGFTMEFFGVWENTADAIDVIRLTPGAGTNWKAGSTFRVYGEPVLGGGSGLVKGDFLPGDLYLGGQVFENEAATGRTELYAVGGAKNPVPEWMSYLTTRQADETPHIDDDFFGSDTSADYTEVTPTGTVNWTFARGRLAARADGQDSADGAVLLKPITTASAPMTIETRISHRGVFDPADFLMSGLCFTDGTAVGSLIVTQHIYTDTITPFMSTRMLTSSPWEGNINNVVDNGAPTFTNFHTSDAVYLRLIWVSANTWAWTVSTNGEDWTDLADAAEAVTMTPTHIGLLVSDWGSAATDSMCTFDYLRVYDTDLSV